MPALAALLALVLGLVLPSPAAAAPRPRPVTVTLERDREAAFQRALARRETPLPPRAQARRFGPSAPRVAAVRAWLRASGYTHIRTSATRLTLTARGTRALRAPPRGVASIGSGVRAAPVAHPQNTTLAGLVCHTVAALAMINYPWDNLPPQYSGMGEVATYWRVYFDCVTLSSRNAHRSAPVARRRAARSSGSGQTIGLLEYAGFNKSDVADYLALTGGDPAAADHVTAVPVDGGPTVSSGPGEAEVLLDVDALVSMVPNANIRVYEAPPSTTWQALFDRMVGDGVTVISNSWTSCESQVSQSEAQAIDSVLAAAAAAGVTVLNATGDTGATCLGTFPNSIGVPSDSPHATAVGGTSFTPGPLGTYGSETWWNGAATTPPTGQGGFGTSAYFARPAFQDGATTAAKRSVPDLALGADPHNGYEICQASDGGCPNGRVYGGTSVSAPVMAGFVALLNERLGHNVGALDPKLYPLAATAFHGPAALGSDFAHVGLGSPRPNAISLALRAEQPGTPTAAASFAAGPGPTPADGSTKATVVVTARDADGDRVPGRHVVLTQAAGGHAVLGAPATTDADGVATFAVTDATAERVALTATDSDDNVVLGTVTADFVVPTAQGALISPQQGSAPSDGTTTATITVYLEDALHRPAPGKTVHLAKTGAAVLTPASGDAVTGADGVATFTATDSQTETATFTATDVTDGNLRVPGSAMVTFEPPGSSNCHDDAPTGSGAHSIETWATGVPFNPRNLTTGSFTLLACSSSAPPAFDASGNVLLATSPNGRIYRLPPDGGAVSAERALPATTFAAGGELGAIAFSGGRLYATAANTAGNFLQPRLVELDPDTGATLRTVLSGPSGLPFCPYAMKADPLSGDLFISDGCNGGLASSTVMRVSDPGGGAPAGAAYTDTGASAMSYDLAPDGTLFLSLSNHQIVSVTGTDKPAPHTPTPITTLGPMPSGIAVAATDAGGHATALYVADWGGSISRIDLTQTPATTTTVASGGSLLGSDDVGPDGCLYQVDLDLVLKLTGACGPPPAGVTLEPAGAVSGVPTGTPATFTITLHGLAAPAGTPIRVAVEGANPQVHLVRASAAGTATFAYSAIVAGGDSVTAEATINGKPVVSAPVRVRWTAGKHTTAVALTGPRQAAAGAPVTLSATLVDVTDDPPHPIQGGVSFFFDGQIACGGNANATGVVTCTTAAPAAGLHTLKAVYGGNGSNLDASTTDLFTVGALGIGPPIYNVPTCGRTEVDLLGAARTGRRVRVTGFADPPLKGKRVMLLAGRKVAGRGRVGKDGYFRIRAKVARRYRARVAALRSETLRLKGRVHLAALRRKGRRVTMTGTLAGGRKLRVLRRAACTRPFRRPKAKVVVRRHRFTVRTTLPAAAYGAAFRLK